MINWTSVVIAGAIVSSPVCDSNRRAKNWMAVIYPEPLMPGGIGRQWMPHARGEFLYVVHTLRVNDPVEFGADYVTTLGRRHPKRWFGVVRVLTDSMIDIENVGSAVATILRSQQLRTMPSQVTA
jgi:hypothetical protein